MIEYNWTWISKMKNFVRKNGRRSYIRQPPEKFDKKITLPEKELIKVTGDLFKCGI